MGREQKNQIPGVNLALCVAHPEVGLALHRAREAGDQPTALANLATSLLGRTVTRQTVHSWIKKGYLDEAVVTGRVAPGVTGEMSRTTSRYPDTPRREAAYQLMLAVAEQMYAIGCDKQIAAAHRNRALSDAGMVCETLFELGGMIELEHQRIDGSA